MNIITPNQRISFIYKESRKAFNINTNFNIKKFYYLSVLFLIINLFKIGNKKKIDK